MSKGGTIVGRLSRDYRYGWHREHDTCTGWADVRAFIDAVGDRPEGHGLSRTSGDVASCGACEDCRAVGASRNVEWTPGRGSSAEAVLYRGERMTQAEAARRMGVERETVRQRMKRGIPLEASKARRSVRGTWQVDGPEATPPKETV